VGRQRRSAPGPGDLYYLPVTDAERLAQAQALCRHAEQAGAERAQGLSEAAEYYALAGQADQAEHLFWAALADGGAVAGSVHGCYAEFLFAPGRAAEALAVIGQARRAHPSDPEVFLVIGETLDGHGCHGEAVKWLTTGLARYYGQLAGIDAGDLREDPDGAMLVFARHRARQAAGPSPDHLDELARPLQEERTASSS
jgi:tetratricopeptide (TPR) repeat protein